MKYVGLQNYTEILSSSSFWWALLNTIYYGLLTIPTSIILSFMLAMLLNNKFKGKNFFRSAFFLPNIFDMLVVGIIWVLIYTPKYGVLDIALNKLGIDYFSNNGILDNRWTVLPAIAVAMVLKGAGFGMILYLTAIQNIETSIFEAAEIDGASTWQRIWNITVPLTKPITFFMIITGTIGCLSAFSEIYAMTGNTGGPSGKFMDDVVRAGNVTGYYLYKEFENGFYGKAAALSFFLMLIGVAISVVNIKLLKQGK